MTQFTVGDAVTKPAGADLTASQFLIVKLNSSAQVVLAAAATDKLFGVIATVPISSATGTPVSVQARNASGTFKVTAGGNIAINDALTANSSGQAVATTNSGDQILGYACEVAVSGQLFEYMPTTGKV